MLLEYDPAHAFMPYPNVEVANTPRGPLVGLTFAVKDLFDVAGYPTSAGNPHWLAMSSVKTKHAPLVQQLLDGGARFVGKTITDELAFSMNGKNAHFGTPINGGAPDRIPGGSSSGSAAAVSHRLCDIAIGSDTGGSVRAPANHCGLFGIRPTHGVLSLQGAHALSPSFDTAGFFAREIDTFARVSEVFFSGQQTNASRNPRLLQPTDVWNLVSDDVRAALSGAYARITRALGEASNTNVALDDFKSMYWAFRYIQGYEAWQVDGAFIERVAPPLGPGVAERFAWSKNVTEQQNQTAWAFRKRFTAHLENLLGDNGVLVMPTMPDIAPKLTDSENALQAYRDAAIEMLCISGLSGLPQITLPLATRTGAPLGISLLGPRGSDRWLVSLAQRVCG
jgi:amidase